MKSIISILIIVMCFCKSIESTAQTTDVNRWKHSIPEMLDNNLILPSAWSFKYGWPKQMMMLLPDSENNKQFQIIAGTNNINLLDSYNLLKINLAEKTTDGIHLNGKTQFELAGLLIRYINKIHKQ